MYPGVYLIVHHTRIYMAVRIRTRTQPCERLPTKPHCHRKRVMRLTRAFAFHNAPYVMQETHVVIVAPASHFAAGVALSVLPAAWIVGAVINYQPFEIHEFVWLRQEPFHSNLMRSLQGRIGHIGADG